MRAGKQGVDVMLVPEIVTSPFAAAINKYSATAL
jgi:hypothetical protein